MVGLPEAHIGVEYLALGGQTLAVEAAGAAGIVLVEVDGGAVERGAPTDGYALAQGIEVKSGSRLFGGGHGRGERIGCRLRRAQVARAVGHEPIGVARGGFYLPIGVGGVGRIGEAGNELRLSAVGLSPHLEAGQIGVGGHGPRDGVGIVVGGSAHYERRRRRYGVGLEHIHHGAECRLVVALVERGYGIEHLMVQVVELYAVHKVRAAYGGVVHNHQRLAVGVGAVEAVAKQIGVGVGLPF